jgi:hypothetical protein
MNKDKGKKKNDKRRTKKATYSEATAVEALKAFAKTRGKAQVKNSATVSEPSLTSTATAPAPSSKSEQKVDLRGELTIKEVKFLEIFLTGEHSINDAMKLAGYEDMTDRNRYLLARKITQKHESQVGDHRKLFRMCGLGEVKVAMKILQLMESESPTVQVRAAELAAKCLGLTKETAEAHPGIQIVIKGDGQAVQVNAGGSAGAPGGPPPRPTTCGQGQESKALPSPKPITILK